MSNSMKGPADEHKLELNACVMFDVLIVCGKYIV